MDPNVVDERFLVLAVEGSLCHYTFVRKFRAKLILDNTFILILTTQLKHPSNRSTHLQHATCQSHNKRDVTIKCKFHTK